MEYEEFIKKVNSYDSTYAKAEFVVNNCNEYIAQYPYNEFKSLLNSVFLSCVKCKIIDLTARLYSSKMILELVNGNYIATENIAKEALLFIEKNGIDVNRKINIISILNTVHYKKGNYYEVIKVSKFLLDEYNFQIQSHIKIRIYQLSGLAYRNLRQYDNALKSHFASIDIAIKENRYETLRSEYSNVGIIYKRLKDYSNALLYFKKSLKIAKKGKLPISSIQLTVGNITDAYYHQSYLKECKKYAKLELDYIPSINNRYIISGIYHNNGLACFLAKEYKKAKDYFLLALNNVHEVKDIERFKDCYEYLFLICLKLKEHKEAIKYQKLFYKYDQKHKSIRQQELLTAYQFKYDYTLKEKQILQLAAENQANVLKINEVLQQHENEKRNQANRIEQQLRDELAHKLHNNVASTLVSSKMYLEELAHSSRLTQHEKNYATKALSQLNTTYNDMRALAQEIKEIDQKDLKTELRQLIDLYSSLPNLSFQSQININTPIDGDFVVDTLGIIKELLTNALKHSFANQFVLKVRANSKHFNLMLKFNGEKFDGTNANKQSSGYQSIRNYLQKYNGTIKHATNSLFSIIEIKININKVKPLG